MVNQAGSAKGTCFLPGECRAETCWKPALTLLSSPISGRTYSGFSPLMDPILSLLYFFRTFERCNPKKASVASSFPPASGVEYKPALEACADTHRDTEQGHWHRQGADRRIWRYRRLRHQSRSSRLREKHDWRRPAVCTSACLRRVKVACWEGDRMRLADPAHILLRS